MNPFSALTKIVKHDLEATFGFGEASVIIVAARKKCGTPSSGISKEDYIKLVNTIADDERVIEKWGTVEVRKRVSTWIAALEKEEY